MEKYILKINEKLYEYDNICGATSKARESMNKGADYRYITIKDESTNRIFEMNEFGNLIFADIKEPQLKQQFMCKYQLVESSNITMMESKIIHREMKKIIDYISKKYSISKRYALNYLLPQ